PRFESGQQHRTHTEIVSQARTGPSAVMTTGPPSPSRSSAQAGSKIAAAPSNALRNPVAADSARPSAGDVFDPPAPVVDSRRHEDSLSLHSVDMASPDVCFGVLPALTSPTRVLVARRTDPQQADPSRLQLGLSRVCQIFARAC